MNSSSRAELERMTDLYLDALAAHDPSRLPLTPQVEFIENNQRLTLGEGSWGTIESVGTYRHYLTEEARSRVGLVGTAFENGDPVILNLLLEIAGGRISAIESYVIRDPVGARRLETTATPHDLWFTSVPLEERVNREAMIATADRYFESMQHNDGKGDYSFFDVACNRVEQGLQSTNVTTDQSYGHAGDTDFPRMSVIEQWKTGFLGFVTEIRDRRYVVIDEERQAIFAFAMFDHDGSIRSITLSNGKVVVLAPYFDVPHTLQVMEAFKLRNGKLIRVEAAMGEVPYGSRPARATS